MSPGIKNLNFHYLVNSKLENKKSRKERRLEERKAAKYSYKNKR